MMAPDDLLDSRSAWAVAASAKEYLPQMRGVIAPASMVANRSWARSRYSGMVAVCAANEGRVKNREPFAFSVASSTADGAPDEAPKDTITPRGRRLSRDASKEIRPIGSYTTSALLPSVMLATSSARVRASNTDTESQPNSFALCTLADDV